MFGGTAEADALYLINVGGNDIRDILIDGLNPGDTIAAAAGTIATQVASLLFVLGLFVIAIRRKQVA